MYIYIYIYLFLACVFIEIRPRQCLACRFAHLSWGLDADGRKRATAPTSSEPAAIPVPILIAS